MRHSETPCCAAGSGALRVVQQRGPCCIAVITASGSRRRSMDGPLSGRAVWGMQYGMGNAFKPHTSTSTTRWARKKNGYGVVPVGYLQCSMGIAVCVVQVVHNAITQSLQINVYLETTYWECETPSSHTLLRHAERGRAY